MNWKQIVAISVLTSALTLIGVFGIVVALIDGSEMTLSCSGTVTTEIAQ